jgi:hypothetical protein
MGPITGFWAKQQVCSWLQRYKEPWNILELTVG